MNQTIEEKAIERALKLADLVETFATTDGSTKIGHVYTLEKLDQLITDTVKMVEGELMIKILKEFKEQNSPDNFISFYVKKMQTLTPPNQPNV